MDTLKEHGIVSCLGFRERALIALNLKNIECPTQGSMGQRRAHRDFENDNNTDTQIKTGRYGNHSWR